MKEATARIKINKLRFLRRYQLKAILRQHGAATRHPA